MSVLEKDLRRLQYNKLTPRPIGLPTGSSNRSGGSRYKRDFSPILYKDYFDCFKTIKLPDSDDTFRVYLSGFQVEPSNSLVLVLLHGGGYSGLTWSLFTKHIRELCVCRVIAIDLRGHGGSLSQNESDLSVSTLTSDIGKVCKAVLDEKNEDIELPPIVIIGHSMGGALAVHCAHQLQEILPSIMGIIVIDVVEGTALDALQSMQSLLKGRPKSFQNLENAIEWCLKSGQTRNLESARVSMPGQLTNSLTGSPATDDITEHTTHDTSGDSKENEADKSTCGRRLFDSSDQIPEENESNDEEETESSQSTTTANLTPRDEHEEQETSKSPESDDRQKPEYVWRINLSKTESYWKGWFQGLSELFLNAPVHGKMLLLAGIDNLDRQLTIGQMQGKFQLQVLPQCGHAVHEDVPEKVADTIATFLVRNRFTEAIKEFGRPFPSC